MPSSRTVDYYCPHCHAHNRAEMWLRVDAEADAELTARLLDGTLFEHACSACGEIAALDHAALFVDKQRRLAIANQPADDALSGAVDLGDPAFQGWNLRAVRDMNALRELAHMWRDGLDDAAMLLLKHMLAARVLQERSKPPVLCAYAGGAREPAESLPFILVQTEESEPEELTVPAGMYRDLCATVGCARDTLMPLGRWVDWDERTAQALWKEVSAARGGKPLPGG